MLEQDTVNCLLFCVVLLLHLPSLLLCQHYELCSAAVIDGFAIDSALYYGHLAATILLSSTASETPVLKIIFWWQVKINISRNVYGGISNIILRSHSNPLNSKYCRALLAQKFQAPRLWSRRKAWWHDCPYFHCIKFERF